MARVKRGVTGHAKHKKVLKAAKGYYGRRKNTIRVAKQAVEKANQYAYRDRKRRKRTFRALWIQRLNAAVRPFGLTYSRFIDGLAQGRRRRSTARCCPISRSASRRRSRRSWRRPRPRCRRRRSRRALSMPARPGIEHRHATARNAVTTGSSVVAAMTAKGSSGIPNVRHRNARTTTSRPTSPPRPTRRALETVRIAALGKNGSIIRAAEDAGHHDAGGAARAGPADQRPQGPVTEAIAARREALKDATLDARLNTETVDVTLPLREPPAEAGRIHPISQVIDELTAIFADMGFAVAEGPDIETDDHNFTKLNIPEGHPAREMHDTFYLQSEAGRLAAAPAHAHLAGADPDHAGAEAADPRDHPGPHLSRRLRPDPHADVPSGRGAGDRQELASRPPEMDPRGVLQGVLRGRPGEDAVPAVVSSRSPSRRSRSTSSAGATRTRSASARARTGWKSSAAAWCIRTCCAIAGSIPTSTRASPGASGIDRIAMLKYGMPDLRAFFEADVRWLSHYGFRPLDFPTLAGGLSHMKFTLAWLKEHLDTDASLAGDRRQADHDRARGREASRTRPRRSRRSPSRA